MTRHSDYTTKPSTQSGEVFLVAVNRFIQAIVFYVFGGGQVKKAVAIIVIGLVVVMTSCKQGSPQKASDYMAFLSLLEEYGFQYYEEKADTDSYLSVERKPVWIGEEIVSVFEYESNAAMEADASGIDRDGYTISNQGRHTNIDWVSAPYFFKKGSLIINYVGENERILAFLNENYGTAFAGNMG